MGNRTEARRLLKQVLERDDSNEVAWMWLASVVESARERRVCLESALEINPANTRAKQELEKLNLSVPLPTPSVKPAERISAPQIETPVPIREAPPVPESDRQFERPRRVRRITPLMLAIGALCLILIAGGGLLALNPQTITPTPAAVTPSATLLFSVLQRTQDAKSAPTLPPRGTIVTRAPSFVSVPPSWTPLPSYTPPPTFVATATALPIEHLTLLFAGEGRGRQVIGLYTISGDGQNEKLLIPAAERAFDAAWSPDGKQIAYITDVDSKEQLAVATSDGTGAQTITHFTGKHTRTPAWSPDGKQIALVADESGNDDLYTISPDGANLKKLTENSVDDRDPTWSPDGKQIAYASDVTGQGFFQIFVLDLVAGKSSQLTESQNSSYSPTWSPDGTRIAFISTRERHANLYTMNPDGSDEQLLSYEDGAAENRDPAWSSDGRWIAFSSNRADGVFNLYAMAPDGSRVTQITHQKSVSIGPRFRPGS